ncbi:MAG: hypothetical protein ABFS14_13020 [Gemmatimonadota bacterium]
MVAVLLLGAAVICLSVLIGCLLPPCSQLRAGDQLIVTAWAGLLLSSSFLLGLSLFMPLGTGVAGGLFVSVGLFSAARGRTRARLRGWIGAAQPGAIAAVILLLLGMAVLANAVRPSGGDYGGYHYPLTLWFTEVGTVPGLGLLHHRFATPASWWTINSLYNVGFMEGRVEPVLGYVSVLLISSHVVIASARILKGRAARPDWFLVAGFALMVPYLSGLLGYPDKPFSDRADEAVAILGLVVAWLFLALSTRRTEEKAGEPRLDRASVVSLMVIAAGAVTLKLSALPILAVAWIFVAATSERRAKAALLAASIAALMVSPLLAFGVVTAGCPLFPASLGCMDLPWALEADTVTWYSSTVTNWARWGTAQPQGSFAEWLSGWVTGQPFLSLSLLTILVGGASGLLISAVRSREIPRWGWPVALAVVGLAYGIVMAPTLRFLTPYIPAVPALVLMWVAARFPSPGQAALSRVAGRYPSVAYLAPALLLFALYALPTPALNLGAAASGNLGRMVRLEEVRWRLPHKIPVDPALEMRLSGDVRYAFPAETIQCGGTPPPCTPFLTYPDIRLRSPEKGIAGGFVRATRPSGQAERPGP